MKQKPPFAPGCYWLFSLALLFFAQGILAQVTDTNPPIRVVDGKLYDLRVSPRWLTLTGEVRRVLTNGLLLQTFQIQNVYESDGTGKTLMGAYGGQNVISARVVGKKRVYGKALVVQNCPNTPNAEQILTCRAMWVTNDTSGLTPLEIWDCGRAATVEEIEAGKGELEAQAKAFAEARAKQKSDRDAQIKAKIVAFQKEQAAKGSAPYQYELGMRYLKGDGVETNREEGIRWLKAAAAQGYEEARKELGRLQIVSP